MNLAPQLGLPSILKRPRTLLACDESEYESSDTIYASPHSRPRLGFSVLSKAELLGNFGYFLRLIEVIIGLRGGSPALFSKKHSGPR